MEQERCGQCGLPIWQCHDDTGKVQFSVEQDTCVAKRQVELEQEKQTKDKKLHGVNFYPSPFFVDGGTWVGVRDAYYEAQAEKAKLLEGR